MQTITAVIPAKNEEKNISRCIESVKWCDKIVVMWMGDDKTGEIARKMGAEVYTRRVMENDSTTLRVLSNFRQVQKNINWAIDHCTTDWILRIDADEIVTKELESEIKSILAPGGRSGRDPGSAHARSTDGRETSDRIWREQIIAYGIPRSQFFCGGFLKGGDWAYDRLVRLFRAKYCRYDPIVPVHEQFKVYPVNGVYGVNGKIGYLKNKLLHYSHPTLKDALNKFQLYTDIEANNIKDNYAIAALKMFILPVYIFLRWMIWHHGYRDGIRGVVAGAFRGWYEFLLYSKYLFGKRKK